MGYFVSQIRKYLRSRGRKINVGAPRIIQSIGWTITFAAAIFIIYTAHTTYKEHVEGDLTLARRLSGRNDLCTTSEDEDNCPTKAPHVALIIPLIIGTLYLFVAIAIVCDEFFVPALEEIGDSWGISDDVAGATLMAAGGSAPELAASMIGTFTGSSVGFGTIVGSAVFNVLFVIACCVVFTPEEFSPLELTAWPLARDCTYYCLCLTMIAVFFGASSPGVIEGWEAACLFCLYLGYVTLMTFNEQLYEKFNGCKIATEQQEEANEDGEKSTDKISSPSRFRAGFFHLISQDAPIFDTAGVSVVSKIKGDVKQVFDKLDEDKSGTIDVHEIKKLLVMLSDDEGASITDTMVEEVMKEVDKDNDGSIDFAEFTVWYVKSEQRLKNEEMKIFHQFDTEQKGYITLDKLGSLLHKMHVHYTPLQLQQAQNHFQGTNASNESEKGQSQSQTKGDDDVSLIGEADQTFGKEGESQGRNASVSITYEEFSTWFEHSQFWEELQHDAECGGDYAEGIWGDLLDFPKSSFTLNLIYVLMAPITWSLGMTAGFKDVRVPGYEGYCYMQFCWSIFWIGAYSYVLVEWVSMIGATLGIPVYIMGLTILAAGTSVPDLLSSVVVARAGKGDMAVSSSIGSNIFDVTVGLPIPWLLFSIVFDCGVTVGADGLILSILILLGMVLFVIISIMLCDWKMNFQLGGVMLFMYVAFVVQDVARIYAKGHVSC